MNLHGQEGFAHFESLPEGNDARGSIRFRDDDGVHFQECCACVMQYLPRAFEFNFTA